VVQVSSLFVLFIGKRQSRYKRKKATEVENSRKDAKVFLFFAALRENFSLGILFGRFGAGRTCFVNCRGF